MTDKQAVLEQLVRFVLSRKCDKKIRIEAAKLYLTHGGDGDGSTSEKLEELMEALQ